MSVKRLCLVLVLLGGSFGLGVEVQAQDGASVVKQLAEKRLQEGAVGGGAADSTKQSPWSFKGNVAVTMTQVMLHNWVPGGENSLSGEATSYLQLDYLKNKHAWTTTLDLGYGLLKQGEAPVVKNLDRIDFNTKYGFAAAPRWYVTGLYSIKTQFAPGYKDPASPKRVLISDFAAPLYMALSLGVDYKYDTHFSGYLSPLAGRMTYVRRQELADAGAFGVKKAELNADGTVKVPGEKVRWELGAMLRLSYVNRFYYDRIGLNTRLELFSNYLEKPQNVDVLFDAVLDYKLLDFLTAKFQLTMVYDDDQKIITESGQSFAALQVRQMLGVGLAYNF